MDDKMSALDELMKNQGWMIHDLVDGNQVDNEEEKRLIKLHNKAAAELASLWARVEALEASNARLKSLLQSSVGYVGYFAETFDADDEDIELHKSILKELENDTTIDVVG